MKNKFAMFGKDHNILQLLGIATNVNSKSNAKS